VKNRSEKTYIKIIITRDADKRIVPEIELEELDKIVTSHLKNSSPCDKDVQMCAVKTIAINNIHNIRCPSQLGRELRRLNHLNKEEVIPMDRIINK